MKKALLVFVVIASSAFFAQAQLQVGVGQNGINVNGQIQGTVDGKPIIVNSQGQVMIGNGKGGGIMVNTNTGQVGVAGTINGNRFNLGFGSGSAGGFGMGSAGGVLGLFQLVQTLVNRSVPLLIGIALLAFFWFIIEFIWKGKDSPEHHEKAKKGMFWSIVALFCMVSVWGIVGAMGSVLGINQGGTMSGYKNPGEQ